MLVEGRDLCMTAAMLVLEPIFEADLPPEQHAYRPGRNAQQAVVEVGEVLFRSHPDVVDADLSDYFGSIPHAELLKSVARRVVDRRVLHLIKQWLECPVEEIDGRGRKRRTTVAKDKQLLESGQLPVDEISVEVSYEDPSFFRRLFKRRTGLTPSQYRRMFQPVISASDQT